MTSHPSGSTPDSIPALEYAQRLIEFDSTCFRSNAAVSDYVQDVLNGLGCQTERIEYRDDRGVDKVSVLGRLAPEGDDARGDTEAPGGFAWFGHTDVVVSDDWAILEHGPFEPTVHSERLYGRGATDMKGPMACMFAALAALRNQPRRRPIYVSCSSDEEIDHRGAVEITKRSEIYRDLVARRAVAVIGEPTQLDVVYAHKGGCQVFVTSHGKAAHSSTREGVNANWAMVPFLQTVREMRDETEHNARWHDHEFDPPTICLNLGINDHNEAVNITAPRSVASVFFRPLPSTDTDELLRRLESRATQLGLSLEIRSRQPPFRTDPASTFVARCQTITGRPAKTVSFGTEASNFPEIADKVILGPGNIAQAHKSDEWIELSQLQAGEAIYRELIRAYCV